MPKSITQYSVFIGSPGGLDEERRRFRESLEKCSRQHGHSKDVAFHPVGWEDTVGGVGRPQAQINEELEQCDYAVFVLHDRWGSPTGGGHTSGTEEEWELAERLYKENKIRNIALFFKKIDPGKRSDPGEQLRQVLAFKKKIEDERRYFFKQYDTFQEFSDTLDGHLAKWLQEHEKSGTGLSLAMTADATSLPSPITIAAPNFEYWISEARKNLTDESANHAAALFCASKAMDTATSEIEWAEAKNLCGAAQVNLGNVHAAISAFTEIADRFSASTDIECIYWHAKALFNKGATLGELGRANEEIAVYDDLLARFGAATEPSLREQVAKALCNKGVALGELGRDDDEIAVYDNLLASFSAAGELPLREQVASALRNKGVALGKLGRADDAIAVYDDLLARFGAATEPGLSKQVASALFNRGATLGQLGRADDEIAVYDDLLARFGAATEPSLREIVARAESRKRSLGKSQKR